MEFDDFDDETGETQEFTPRQVRLQVWKDRIIRTYRDTIASDLLLAALYRHHPDHAVANLKGVKPTVVDLEPPEPPPAAVLKAVDLPATLENIPVVTDRPLTPTMAQILDHVCWFYEVRPVHIMSSRRDVSICKPRQVCMYLCRELTPRSLPEIGNFLGGKDHTSVLHGARKIKANLETDQRLKDEVSVLEYELSQRVLKEARERSVVALRISTGDTQCNSAQTAAI